MRHVTRAVIVLIIALTSVMATAAPAPPDGADSGAFVLSSGWNESELRKILADFRDRYRTQLPEGYQTRLRCAGKSKWRVEFRSHMPGDLLVFLVNYIHYPVDFDLRRRVIAAVGSAEVSRDFNPPSPRMTGRRVWIYVPDADTEFDEVFIQLDGDTYRQSFTDLRWSRARSQRISKAAAELMALKRIPTDCASRS